MSEEGERIGCGDSLCEFGHPPGMHTNGGCQCFKIYGLDREQRDQLMRIRRFVKLQRERIADLEQLRTRATLATRLRERFDEPGLDPAEWANELIEEFVAEYDALPLSQGEGARNSSGGVE